MVHDVYITRADDPSNGGQVPIPEGDWRTIIANDPELETPDEAYPSYAVWVERPPPGPNWIDWVDGNLFTRSPDVPMLRKLLEVAELLGASVRSGGGERYRLDEAGAVSVEPSTAAPVPPRPDAPTGAGAVPIDELRSERIPPRPEQTGPPAPSLEGSLLGPRPRNVEEDLEFEADGLELHADASFARSAEALLGAEKAEGSGDPPFRVGQRVRTEWGRPATIVSIDGAARDGLGEIEIRYDDGRVATTSSPRLERLDE